VTRPCVRRLPEALRDPVAKPFKVWADNVVVSKPKVSCHVLEEAPLRPDASNVSLNDGPEVAGVVDSTALSCD
jgi:hypothetical protein